MREATISTPAFEKLVTEMKACTICADLPLGPKPIFKLSPTARILVAGQAPGSKTHAKGIPFDDASGDNLRRWLGIDRDIFYNHEALAILPMGFCYPGTGKSGDLPPRTECEQAWRKSALGHMPLLEFTIIIGRYAIDWHMPDYASKSVTEAAKDWRALLPNHIILPHPSPRNNRWLKQNPWFEEEVLPAVKERVAVLLGK